MEGNPQPAPVDQRSYDDAAPASLARSGPRAAKSLDCVPMHVSKGVSGPGPSSSEYEGM
jgi:hypothetical protein